jgi:hypothetical protein
MPSERHKRERDVLHDAQRERGTPYYAQRMARRAAARASDSQVSYFSNLSSSSVVTSALLLTFYRLLLELTSLSLNSPRLRFSLYRLAIKWQVYAYFLSPCLTARYLLTKTA